jgi:hypothetical protein
MKGRWFNPFFLIGVCAFWMADAIVDAGDWIQDRREQKFVKAYRAEIEKREGRP